MFPDVLQFAKDILTRFVGAVLEIVVAAVSIAIAALGTRAAGGPFATTPSPA